MTGLNLPEIPASLKNIQHYLKIASTYDERDCVVSYWCRLYALQIGLKLSTKTAAETNCLIKLMDWLETTKKESRDNEAITNEIAAQAHLENWALKLFLYADKNDRASNFGKNVIQSFYTAGLLYDVLSVFGELSEESLQNKKYAKWKAAYLHNCEKNGETPIPGPIDDRNEENDFIDTSEKVSNNPDSSSTFPDATFNQGNTSDSNVSSPTNSNSHNPASTLMNVGVPEMQTPDFQDYNASVKAEGGVSLTTEQMTKAQKYIKWAGSALNYDDVPTAVLNLQKAMQLLTAGEDSG